MRKVKIVADSSANILELQNITFAEAPLKVITGAAQELKRMLLDELPQIDVQIHRCRGLCSYYAEKGGLLVGFEKF